MPYTTLMSTADLAARLGAPGLVIVDCRFDLKDTAAGQAAFAASHIPGAVYANLDSDLSGPKSGSNGRHPLPAPAAFAVTLGRLGIGNDTQVVAYDASSGMYASRLWWMLRWMGHDAVPVLDGGWPKWTSEERPVTAGAPVVGAGTFVPHVRPEMLQTVADVEAAAGRRLIDARSPERFRGENETLDKAAGHIPGAVNRFFQDNVRADGTFKAPEELAAGWRDALGSAQPDEAICYCGSGVTACHNLLALELAGIHGVKLYAGSWSEWSADPGRPTETGGGDAR